MKDCLRPCAELDDEGRQDLTVLDVIALGYGGLYSMPDSDSPFVHRNRHGLLKELTSDPSVGDQRAILVSGEYARRGPAQRAPWTRAGK